jgi:type IV pilus assembly protein PilA
VNAEEKIAGGLIGSTAITAAVDIGLQASSDRCTYTVSVAADGTASIACAFKGNAQVNTSKIVWTRTSDTSATTPGAWVCSTNVAAKLRPSTCQTAAAT